MSQSIAIIIAGTLIAAAIVLNTAVILLTNHRIPNAPGFLRSLEHTGTVTRTNNTRPH
jgi:hypothetical protein